MKIIFRKAVSIILSALILCTLLNSISVFADPPTITKTVDVTCSVDKTTVVGGQSFTETIGLSNFVNVVGGVQAFKFVINYDTSKFSCNVFDIVGRTSHTQKNIKNQDIPYSDLTVTPLTNQVVIVYLENGSGATPISTDGPVLTVKFTANADDPSGVNSFILNSGDTNTFVDCDAPMPADLRDVYPTFLPAANQQITVVSSAKKITGFNFTNPSSVGVINDTNITVKVPFVTNLTNLVANFVSSPSSTVKVGDVTQISGVTKNDFTNPVVYTVTADDGSANNYTVTIDNSKSSSNDITQFNFSAPNSSGSIDGTNIILIVPFVTNLTNLVANFISSDYSTVKVGDVTQISGVTKNDFSKPVIYTVVAENGSTNDYTVTVNNAKSLANDITKFGFSTPSADGTFNNSDITVPVPCGTNLTKLVADFSSSDYSTVTVGGVTQVSGTTANNFTNPVTYIVTSEGGTTKDYTVTVSPAKNDAKDIGTFSLSGSKGTVSTDSIAVTVPFGTNVNSLVATFTTTGNSVKVGSVTQVSGTTANNFTNSVKYTVTAQDGSTKDYTVTVIVALSSEKDIVTFSVSGVQATISGTNITATVPYGTDLLNLVASFTSTGKNVAVAGITQISGESANNFIKKVGYDVTAIDGSTKIYQVTILVAPKSEKDINTFSILGYPGTINGTDIRVNVGYGTDLTNLVATYTTLGDSVLVGGKVQTPGITANDFSKPVTYTVVAQDGSQKNYTVTVIVASPQDKVIQSFSITDSVGVINGTNISVTVPYGSNMKNLVATFTFLGASVKVGNATQSSGITPNDFSNPVVYTVLANDNTTSNYTVTVKVAAEIVPIIPSSSSSLVSSSTSSKPIAKNSVNLYFIIILISLFLLVVAGVLWIVLRKKQF